MLQQSPIEQFKEKLQKQFVNSKDLITKQCTHNGQTMHLLYLNSVSDVKKIKNEVISPFLAYDKLIDFENHLSSLPNSTSIKNINGCVESILEGSLVVFLPQALFLINVKKEPNSKPSEVSIENNIFGPRIGLSEDLETSITQIRSRYVSPMLKTWETTVGAKSKTNVTLVYDEELVDKDLLEQVKSKISAIKVDIMIAAGQLENFINNKKRTLFPTMVVTERPDRIVLNLAQGKVIMLINGTPFALIAPAVFYDFFSAMDDVYTSYWVRNFILSLRYIGLFVSLTVPALYVAITSYNPEIVRIQLALSIAGSRSAVPYPSFIEVFFMLIMMELLTEASLRLPKAIGSTATTVGGLILGQAAQQAGLVSSIMIIVVAAVSIANYVIPINSMSIAIRIAKYVLLIFSILFGVIGVVGAIVAFIILLCRQRSFGRPYFKLFLNEHRIAKSNQRGTVQ